MFDLNMKVSDFENLGKIQFDKGMNHALNIVIKLLRDRICSDYNADSTCEHDVCAQNFELSESLETVKRGPVGKEVW
jgi:hypothetical protein